VTSATTRRTVLPGFRLTMGFTLVYLGLVVLVPLMTLPARSATMTWAAFWEVHRGRAGAFTCNRHGAVC
jgi:sulfate transport system permease protein